MYVFPIKITIKIRSLMTSFSGTAPSCFTVIRLYMHNYTCRGIKTTFHHRHSVRDRFSTYLATRGPPPTSSITTVTEIHTLLPDQCSIELRQHKFQFFSVFFLSYPLPICLYQIFVLVICRHSRYSSYFQISC